MPGSPSSANQAEVTGHGGARRIPREGRLACTARSPAASRSTSARRRRRARLEFERHVVHRLSPEITSPTSSASLAVTVAATGGGGCAQGRRGGRRGGRRCHLVGKRKRRSQRSRSSRWAQSGPRWRVMASRAQQPEPPSSPRTSLKARRRDTTRRRSDAARRRRPQPASTTATDGHAPARAARRAAGTRGAPAPADDRQEAGSAGPRRATRREGPAHETAEAEDQRGGSTVRGGRERGGTFPINHFELSGSWRGDNAMAPESRQSGAWCHQCVRADHRRLVAARTIASASISTRWSPIRPATRTSVLAGLMSPRTRPCAREIASTSASSVM